MRGRVINWGRWTAALLIGAGGLDFLVSRGIPALIGSFRKGQTFYPFYIDVLLSMPPILCAWGLLKWRDWAHTLAVRLCVFSLAMLPIAVISVRHSGFQPPERFWLVLGFSAVFDVFVLVWLQLPAVRRRYHQDQLA